MSLSLTSSSFSDQAEIPQRHTCEGDDLSPPLAWSGAPPGTRSFALIVDDPDAPDPRAPKTTWVHWVLYDIPADVVSLPEGAHDLPDAVRQGLNDWKRTGYGGPCPPIGRHRYRHQLYALDTVLGDLGRPARAARSSGRWKGTCWRGRCSPGPFRSGASRRAPLAPARNPLPAIEAESPR